MAPSKRGAELIQNLDAQTGPASLRQPGQGNPVDAALAGGDDEEREQREREQRRLVHALSSGDEEARRDAVADIAELAMGDGPACPTLVGAIPLLVPLLDAPSDDTLLDALFVLAQLARNTSECCETIVGEGAVPLLIRMLQRSPGLVVHHAAQLTAQLARLRHMPSRATIATAIPSLVALLGVHQDRISLCASLCASSALSHLASDSPSRCQRIIDHGGILQLVPLLEHASRGVAANAVAVLADLVRECPPCHSAVVDAVPALVALLKVSSHDTQADATAILCRLASCPDRCRAVVRSGAVQPLVGMLSSAPDDLKRSAAVLLATLAHHHKLCCVDIASAGAVPPLGSMCNAAETTQASVSALRMAEGGVQSADLLGLLPRLRVIASEPHDASIRRDASRAVALLASRALGTDARTAADARTGANGRTANGARTAMDARDEVPGSTDRQPAQRPALQQHVGMRTADGQGGPLPSQDGSRELPNAGPGSGAPHPHPSHPSAGDPHRLPTMTSAASASPPGSGVLGSAYLRRGSTVRTEAAARVRAPQPTSDSAPPSARTPTGPQPPLSRKALLGSPLPQAPGSAVEGSTAAESQRKRKWAPANSTADPRSPEEQRRRVLRPRPAPSAAAEARADRPRRSYGSLTISGALQTRVNGRYRLVGALPKDAIEKPTKGFPIWRHETATEIHILRVKGEWWISHYQPADHKDGKDYYYDKPAHGKEVRAVAEVPWQWKTTAHKEERLRIDFTFKA